MANPTHTAVFSHEETMKLINDRAREGGDSFTLRVTQKRPGAMISTVILAFRGAGSSHFMTPEAWLPQIVGGGEYQISASHNSEANERIGSPILLKFDGTPSPRLLIEATRHPAWQGPSDLIYPNVEAQAAAGQAPAPVQQAQQGGQPGTGGPAQPQTQQFGGVTFTSGWGAPGQAQQAPGGAPAPMQMHGMSADAASLLQLEARAREEVNRQREHLEKERLEAAFEMKLERAKLDMQRELSQREAARPAEKPAPALTEVIPAILSAIGPFWLQIQNANREAAERQAIRDRESQARFDQMAAESRTMMMTFVDKLSTRNDPSKEVMQIIEITKMQSAGHAELMSKTVEAMGTMSKISIGMIETMADQLQGPEANPMLEGIREITKAFGVLSAGTKNGAQKMVTAQQRVMEANARQNQQDQQQMAASQAGVQAQQAQQYRAQQAQQAAQAGAAGASQNGSHAQAVQQPAPVVEFQKPGPSPVPNVPPASEVVTELGEPSAFGYVPDAVEQLEQMIREHADVNVVAQFFFKALATEEMQAALEEHGDIPNLLGAKLGTWMQDLGNMAYMTQLGQTLDKVGHELGAFEEEGGSDEGEEVDGSVAD